MIKEVKFKDGSRDDTIYIEEFIPQSKIYSGPSVIIDSYNYLEGIRVKSEKFLTRDKKGLWFIFNKRKIYI